MKVYFETPSFFVLSYNAVYRNYSVTLFFLPFVVFSFMDFFSS